MQKTILKKISFDFFRKRLMVLKKERSARQTTFSQAGISYESEEVPFDEMIVSEIKTHRAKKAGKGLFYNH